MGQTITEKIFSHHVGKKVYADDIVECDIDMVIGNDITTPISIKEFEKVGAKKLAKPKNFAIVMDHFIPAKDIASANQARISRDFALKHDLEYFFDERDMGIEHALMPEKGLVVSGDVIIGADSHIHTNDRQRNFIISLTISTYYFCIVQSVIFLQIIHSYHNPYRIYNIEGYHA